MLARCLYVVSSFAQEDVSYMVQVGNGSIRSCMCFDFNQRRKPCKHMYPLKRKINLPVASNLMEHIPLQEEVAVSEVDRESTTMQSSNIVQRFNHIFQMQQTSVKTQLIREWTAMKLVYSCLKTHQRQQGIQKKQTCQSISCKRKRRCQAYIPVT